MLLDDIVCVAAGGVSITAFVDIVCVAAGGISITAFV
jgi:hypothetical protein